MKKHKLLENMSVSNSAVTLREAIDKAVEDSLITREEYDRIITIAAEDGEIDPQEQVLLKEFHQMIYDKDIKFKTSQLSNEKLLPLIRLVFFIRTPSKVKLSSCL